MPIQFNSILVPVDLSVNTEIAIKKALEIADPGATIHLLHILENSLPGFISAAFKFIDGRKLDQCKTEKYMQQWRAAVEETDKALKACVWITVSDSIQNGIEKFSKKIKPDLIIIGKHNYHSWGRLSEKVICSRIVTNTGFAVLAVKPGSFHNRTRKLIVPMETHIPEEKMKMIIGISKMYRLKIYLLSFVPATHTDLPLHAVSLLNTYRSLSSSIRCPVEYVVLKRSNNSRALLDYAKKIQGNILLVFAGIETDSGMMKRDIADAIRPDSNIEVLTISKNARDTG